VKLFAVAWDVLREAASRRWILALGVVLTLALVLLALGLQMSLVQGALSATKLFGSYLPTDIQPADVALRPIFSAAAYVIYYAGLPFGILVCADFAPKLLAPGRIEHLLSLPLRRWELLAGTLLGVLVLSTAAALYAAGGLALVLGFKTGVWVVGPLVAALIAGVSFTAIYTGMLATSVFVRSAPLAAGVGFALFWAGVLSSYRADLFRFFEPGFGRAVFSALTLLVPRVSALATAASQISSGAPIETGRFAALVGGALAFALGTFGVSAVKFARKDY
jgi:ABC-type transport system involved in multi-copper enzyme maturation permease subunit